MRITAPILLLSGAALFAAGCQTGAGTANDPATKPAANIVANNAQSSTPPANVDTNQYQKPLSNTSAPAPDTPTAAYKAAYAARKNKDIKTLKTLISKDMTEFFEILAEGKKGDEAVDAALKDLVEQPQGPTDETRNEKIEGNTATLQYKDAKGEWVTADFVKEDGGWKMTIAKMDGKKK